MIGMFSGIAKAALGAALLPVDVVADIVTLGGAINEQDESYTGKRIRQIGDAIDETTEE